MTRVFNIGFYVVSNKGAFSVDRLDVTGYLLAACSFFQLPVLEPRCCKVKTILYELSSDNGQQIHVRQSIRDSLLEKANISSAQRVATNVGKRLFI